VSLWVSVCRYGNSYIRFMMRNDRPHLIHNMRIGEAWVYSGSDSNQSQWILGLFKGFMVQTNPNESYIKGSWFKPNPMHLIYEVPVQTNPNESYIKGSWFKLNPMHLIYEVPVQTNPNESYLGGSGFKPTPMSLIQGVYTSNQPQCRPILFGGSRSNQPQWILFRWFRVQTNPNEPYLRGSYFKPTPM